MLVNCWKFEEYDTVDMVLIWLYDELSCYVENHYLKFHLLKYNTIGNSKLTKKHCLTVGTNQSIFDNLITTRELIFGVGDTIELYENDGVYSLKVKPKSIDKTVEVF